MSRTIALVAAVALVLLSGAVAGMWTNRWGWSMTTKEGAERLAQVPAAIEGWDCQETKLHDREVQIGEIDGYISRRYTHQRTGAVVSVLVLCGRPGPISVHAPEVCYTNSGWTQLNTAKYRSGAGPFAFDVLDMQKPGVAQPSYLRLYMAMGSRGKWSVPQSPRIAFAGQASLFKVYVIQEALALPESNDHGPAVDLLTVLMPRLQEKLFPDQ